MTQGFEVLDECRQRLADASDMLAELRTHDTSIVVLAEATAAAHLVDRALFAVDRARACQRHTIIRHIAQARIDGGGDRFLLSDTQARIVAAALNSNVPAIHAIATTGRVGPRAVDQIRTEIERVVDNIATGRHALWEFGALRALEIYAQHRRRARAAPVGSTG